MTADIHITCPACSERGEPDVRLVERVNGASGDPFLGCQNYPRCKYTQELPTWVILERSRASKLPGFDVL